MDGSVGQLFIELGIKGSEKTVGALVSVKEGMGDVKSMSLEAKAAILGAVYGLEQMMHHSLEVGSTMTNASIALGMTSDQLYRYSTAIDIAANKTGVGKAAFDALGRASEGAIRGVLPPGLVQANQDLARFHKDLMISREDLLNNKPLVLKKLQAIEQTPELSAQQKALALNWVGGEDFIAALAKGAVSEQSLARVPTPSASQLATMDRVNTEIALAKSQISLMFMNFTAKHGEELAKDFLTLVPNVIKLTDAILALIEAIHGFKILGKAASQTSDILSAAAKFGEGVAQKAAEQTAKSPPENFNSGNIGTMFRNSWRAPMWPVPPALLDMPKLPEVHVPDITPSVKGSHASNINIHAPYNQTVHGVDLRDEKQVANLERERLNYQNTSFANLRLS